MAVPSCPIGRSGGNKKGGTAVDKNRREVVVEQGRSALGSVRETFREGLMDLVVRSGMAALRELLEADREVLCGPRYVHQAGRTAYRHGHGSGELVLGGRRVSVRRPRVRAKNGTEIELPSWTQYAAVDPLRERILEQLLVGVAARKYSRSLEPLPGEIEVSGTSRSAVSRQFVAMTAERLEAWQKRSLAALDLTALMIDGVHFADHVVLVALGFDAQGNKHDLGICEGATENAAACAALLADLQERGLRIDRSVLVVIDGSKALAKAVRNAFGSLALIQRCQEHKKRNVRDHLPEAMRPMAKSVMNNAFRCRDAQRGERMLEKFAKRAERDHPGAAASLREGLKEMFTVMALRLPVALERTFSTTNSIENLVGSARILTRNVKRWRDGRMVLRWVATGIQEAAKSFRSVRGHAGMGKLVAALRRRDAHLNKTVDPLRRAA